METPGQKINSLPIGVFQTLLKIKPSGALQARKQASNAVAFFWRYSIGSKSERVPIGLYDPSAAPKSLTPTKKGFSVAAAVRTAETLALQHHQHKADGGRPALLAAEREAQRIAHDAQQQAAQNTLKNLLNDYSDHLEKLGRISHRETRSIFKVHVFDPWPELTLLPAKDVTGEQIADMMRRAMDAGKGRTANKLRSYVRAAYQTAKAARSKASIPIHFKAYNIAQNPVADTEPDESQNRPDKNPLSKDEMRKYWQNIKSMPGLKGAVLRLHLLTGGQRIEQLVRLRTKDIFLDNFLLYDGKGRPGKSPRTHTVPLLADAFTALQACEPKGEFALSTDGGGTHLAGTTLSAWAVEAAVGIEEFRTKRIRSGVETLLASADISTEIRGRLQSHGIAGVQARHYDGYNYLKEKRRALDTLFELLENSEKCASVLDTGINGDA